MSLFGNDKIIVGYDLGDEYSQISYCCQDSGEVETLSQVAGEESYNIPTALLKRNGVNQWFYGREAVKYKDQGIYIDHLLELALSGEPVIIEEVSFDPVALLALFFKRSLGLLNQVCAQEKIYGIMITCDTVDKTVLNVLDRILERVHLKVEHVCYQSHMESYYHYMISQPRELWNSQSLLFHYRSDGMKVLRLENNKRTTPMVFFIEETFYDFNADPLQGQYDQCDERLLDIAGEMCEGRITDSIYLIGDRFRQDWMKRSLSFFCRKARVFQGSNLFSKGACLGMKERVRPVEKNEFVFLGNEKLKANVGMKLFRQGEESYYAILDAGVNWYDAVHEMEFYIKDGSEISLVITPLIGRETRSVTIRLEELPGSIARLWARFSMESEAVLVVEIEDLGFGEIRSSDGKCWSEKIELY